MSMTREEKLSKALQYAMAMLIRFEPGDSRVVSNEFVALAMVDAGIDNEECWKIINAEVKYEKAENSNQLTVTMEAA